MRSGAPRLNNFGLTPLRRPSGLAATIGVAQCTIPFYAPLRSGHQAAGVAHVKWMAAAVLVLTSLHPAQAQIAPCYAGFELSAACITSRHLDQKAAVFRRKIQEAMTTLGASYQIRLRLVNHPVEGGYDVEAGSDVFTEVVRDEQMRNESFVINVTAEFLESQPEILFESSSLHEVCHIINDDLTGYHRNGANIEAAEERCVLQATGEARYRQFLQAYAKYQHWNNSTYEAVLQKVKDVVLVPAPIEKDEADQAAAKYFRSHPDGKEHLLVYNGELHDVTPSSRDALRHDPEMLKGLIAAGRPIIFFHNHSVENGRAAMFPTHADFGLAALFSSVVYRENAQIPLEFRVMQVGEEDTVVSYGFKGTALEQIRNLATEYRTVVSGKTNPAHIELSQNLLESHLEQESSRDYLQYVCPADLPRSNAGVCRTHPQYFLWPSDRFFIHDRPQ